MTVFQCVSERAYIIEIGGYNSSKEDSHFINNLKYNSISTIHTVAVANKEQTSELNFTLNNLKMYL